MAIVELAGARQLAEEAEGDPAAVWAAQADADGRLGPGVRAWAAGGATAVASPRLSRRPRLAVRGPADAAAVLVRHALAECGPDYRPFGERELMHGLAARVDGLAVRGEFSWMDTDAPPPGRDADAGVRWLGSGEEPAVAALLGAVFPASYAQPGAAGVARWAGAEDGGGALRAVAADAWSGAGCGFLAGVTVRPDARGAGLAGAVAGFVLTALVRTYGACGLMVDDDNPAAIRVYERLGMRRRLVAAVSADAG